MRIFIAHILPNKEVLKYQLSVAASNFCWNLIEGGVFDKVYSILPPFFKGNLAVDYQDLVYSDWRLSNGIKGKFAAIKEQWIVYRRIPKGASVWFYNMTLINCFLFFLLRFFSPSVQTNVIVLDYTPYKKKFSVAYWMLWLCNKAHGMIKLANSPLFKLKNFRLLPGVVPQNAECHPRVENITKDFLISGNLREEISSLTMLLDAFAKIPDYRLHISGFCEDDAIIREYTRTYSNIIFYGKVEYEEYVRLLGKIPFLLSTRNPLAPENQCNFPSKIIEALLYNRIIVSTLHYEQLNGIKYFEVSSSVDNFITDIQKIFLLTSAEILSYANQSDEVKRKFCVDVWNRAMSDVENFQR